MFFVLHFMENGHYVEINKIKSTLYKNMCFLISLLCTVYYLFILSLTDFLP